MLELKNITKTYQLGLFGKKKLNAVDNISFSIKDGEIVSLIGESGSGKTTVGKIILKLINPTSGQLLYNNEDVANLKGNDLKSYYYKVQGVFQDPFSSFNPIFKADRIFDMIHKEFYSNLNNNEWNTKVEDTIKSVGLNPKEVLNKFAHQLSGGQLQRFLIARALLLNVKFLVADEIISMLDASTRIDVLNLLGELKKKGLSILFITHDLNLGYYISDSVLIMYRGAMVEIGSTEEIFNNPLHPYTQMLLESVPRLDKHWGEPIPLKPKEIKKHEESLCRYYDRCTRIDAECLHPPMIEINPNHFVACISHKNS